MVRVMWTSPGGIGVKLALDVSAAPQDPEPVIQNPKTLNEANEGSTQSICDTAPTADSFWRSSLQIRSELLESTSNKCSLM